MPFLHINADDFGLHPDIDRGILACAEAKRVTGVSVVAGGASLDWSVARELAARGIEMGVHATLVGEPWLTRPIVFANWSRLVPWLLIPGRRAMLEAELREQAGRFIANGLKPIHLDSHQHVHVMPTVWPAVVKIADEFGIGRIRVPATPDRSTAKRSVAGRVLQRLSESRRRPGSPPCIGIAAAGHNTSARLIAELEASRGQDLELVAHPAIDTPALQAKYASWRFDWKTEQAALLSDELGAATVRLGYRIASPRVAHVG